MEGFCSVRKNKCGLYKFVFLLLGYQSYYYYYSPPIACSRTSIVLSFCHSEQTRLVLTTCFLLGTELRGFRGKNKKIRVNLQNSMPDTLLMSWLAR